MTVEWTTGMNLGLKEQAEEGAEGMPQRKGLFVVVERHRLTLAVLVGMTAGSPAAVA